MSQYKKMKTKIFLLLCLVVSSAAAQKKAGVIKALNSKSLISNLKGQFTTIRVDSAIVDGYNIDKKIIGDSNGMAELIINIKKFHFNFEMGATMNFILVEPAGDTTGYYIYFEDIYILQNGVKNILLIPCFFEFEEVKNSKFTLKLYEDILILIKNAVENKMKNK